MSIKLLQFPQDLSVVGAHGGNLYQLTYVYHDKHAGGLSEHTATVLADCAAEACETFHMASPNTKIRRIVVLPS